MNICIEDIAARGKRALMEVTVNLSKLDFVENHAQIQPILSHCSKYGVFKDMTR